MEAPLLQIRGDRVEVSDDAEEIVAAARVFHDGGFLRFPTLLDDAALAAWSDGDAVARVTTMLSAPRVLALIGRITGAEAASAFRPDPGALDDEGWHDGPTRRCVAALAVHVGREACRGSTLEMRQGEGRQVVSIPTTTPGDAVLFRFEAGLRYRMRSGTDTLESRFTGRFVRSP